ncbi:hypothetical protein DSO57_1037808 [Entomophthora muscae]|uniref:Uncharacterized protein n=1 Tax=Entomophthora muscae TaxID=34485 RepID=A0ACC2T9Y4_9FUNG|nr:hypothetical protein DSO57_1037808 [Entomophthora muscae]
MRGYTLSSGNSIPSVGLGTCKMQCYFLYYKPSYSCSPTLLYLTLRTLAGGDFQDVVKIVKNAIDSGYRHIDTGANYKNEEMVGEAIKDSNIPRGEFFITTKLWCTDLLPERVRPALELSLKKLQVEYVDLYLIHWPVAFKSPQTTPPEVIPVDLSETWKELEALVFEGKIKSIGVSNFTIKKLDKLLETARIKPAVNQVELHPYLTQLDLKNYCDENNILLSAYSPLGRSEVPRIDSDPTVFDHLGVKTNV